MRKKWKKYAQKIQKICAQNRKNMCKPLKICAKPEKYVQKLKNMRRKNRENMHKKYKMCA